eukprot:687587-Prymnesium_polylepis.1
MAVVGRVGRGPSLRRAACQTRPLASASAHTGHALHFELLHITSGFSLPPMRHQPGHAGPTGCGCRGWGS